MSASPLPKRHVCLDIPFFLPESCKTTEFDSAPPTSPPSDALASGWCPLQFTNDATTVIQQGRHRSGWPYAMRCIAHLDSGEGCLFDDFIEHKFCYQSNPDPYTAPWIGLTHHPPNFPKVGNANEDLRNVFASPSWQRSQPHLLGLIAMSQYAGEFVSRETQVPVACLKHPTEIPELTWSPDAFRKNRFRWIVQLGWYLRNTRVLDQTPPFPGLRKIRIWPPFQSNLLWIADYDARVEDYWREDDTRQSYGDVDDYPKMSDGQYDRMLSRNIAITEVFDASANNVVIECAARHTPLIVNRNPAVVEYLGADYPLYFDDVQQIPELCREEIIVAGHEHLVALDKSWMDGAYFAQQLQTATSILVLNRRDAG